MRLRYSMITLKIAPLSINRAYQGRRFLTKEAKSYIDQVLRLLPAMKVPEGKLVARYKFYVSSKASDADNLVKMMQDCLQKKYGFNDRQIYWIEIEKFDVKKGDERIEFEIGEYKVY